MPHCPEAALPRKRSHNQGPASIATLVPSAKSAITAAPCQAWLLMAATSNAEYSNPHGSKAQSMPTQNGASWPRPATSPCTPAQTRRAPDLQPDRLPGLPHQQQPQHQRSHVKQTPHRAQGRRLHRQPTQPLDGGCGQPAQCCVAHDAPELEQAHRTVPMGTRRLAQTGTSRAAHGHTMRAAGQAHE